METVKIRITGTSPLLMHSDRLVNTFDPLAKEIKMLTNKKKKTEEIQYEILRLKWKGAMYYDDKIGPYIPAHVLKACILRASTKTKEGPKVRSGLMVLDDKNKLEYDGARDMDKMWKNGKFTDIRAVCVGRSRVMGCRPVFNNWILNASIIVDPTQLEPADVLRFLETAGQLVGMCDFRPEKGGNFGRFSAEEI